MADLSNAPRPIDLAIEEIDDLERRANEWAGIVAIATPEQASRLADLDQLLLKLHQKIDAEREDLRRPHLDAAKAVQQLYAPQLSRVSACRTLLGNLLTSWKLKLQRQLDAERAAKAKAAAEASRKAEEARRRAEAPKTVADITRAERLAEAAAEAAKAAAAVPERAQVVGELSGKLTSLRVRWIATEITDVDEAYLWAREQDRGEVEAFLLKLANAEVRHGVRVIPGVKIEKEEK